MNAIKTVQEAFEREGLDADQVKVTGIPERHVEAVIAIAKLFVVHDAVNPEFKPDYNDNLRQFKFENFFYIKNTFSDSCVRWNGETSFSTCSYVGARLVSESPDAARHIAKHFPDLYKAFMVYERKPNELFNP